MLLLLLVLERQEAVFIATAVLKTSGIALSLGTIGIETRGKSGEKDDKTRSVKF